ncbi:DUF1345 domain-containing protein [Microbacterium gorillae]|uniref:DUF1345 domain-containing protein n=1 Tax=Microbacterium gorillae TaxID=1231063 RepID=UPI00058FC9AB|nr:DUF1345 domain-containing protein [Microbacterium gorillae]
MGARRAQRKYARVFDDGIRASWASAAAILVTFGVVVLVLAIGGGEIDRPSTGPMWFITTGETSLTLVCLFWLIYSVIYLVWTHLLFSRTPRATVRSIANVQHHRRPSAGARLFGAGADGTGAVTASFMALVAALGTAIIGIGATEWWRIVLVILTVAGSWAAMVYSFALRYLRLDAAGERVEFDIVEDPEFSDFVSLGVAISTGGAVSAARPRTRDVLSAMRTHALSAFIFNTLVIAMTVSLIVGLLT